MLYTALIFLLIYIQNDIVYLLVSMVSCRNLGDKYYILANLTYDCYTEDYYSYLNKLILPFLLFWVIILPAILFVFLFRNRKNLHKSNISLKYGILYKEY